MSEFQNAKTEETVEEDDSVKTDTEGKNANDERMNMHLQLTVEGDEPNPPRMKDFETQESPERNKNGEFFNWRGSQTQESPSHTAGKDSIRAFRTEEDAEANNSEVQGFVSGPPADYFGSKTLDDDLKAPDGNHRVMRTVEEDDDDPRHNQVYVDTKVIWKLLEVRPHQKNVDPVSKMLHLLPAEAIVKGIGQWTLFGRGENVDVYLHDLLSSRKHAEFTITRDNRNENSQRFVAMIRNKSELKKIKVNGNRELNSGEVYELRNNDQISIGVFTFIIEIVRGDSRSKKYELKFALQALPSVMPYPSSEIPQNPPESRRMPSPIAQPSEPPRLVRQPVENTEDQHRVSRVPQENDESEFKSQEEDPQFQN